MFLTGHARFFERLFVGIIILTLSCFAYYFTLSDLDELRERFENRRTVLVKIVAREIKEALGRKGDLSARLSNLISEEAIAYALVQQSEEELLAKAENTSVAIGVMKDLEKNALQASSLRYTPFVDLSGSLSLIEAAIPVFLDSGRRVVLRIGFYKGDEDERTRQIWFRNTLLFSTLLLGVLTYLLLRRRGSFGLQITWMGGAGLLILLVFLSCRFTIHQWYDRYWRQSFIRNSMNQAKILAISARRFFLSGEDKDLRDLQSLLEFDDTFAYVGVIRDDQFLYHTDPAMKGKPITDPAYRQSIDQNKPLCKKADDDMYEVFVPVLDGLHQLGTLKIGLRYSAGFEPLKILRNHILLIFLSGFSIALFLIYLLTTRVTRDVTSFIRAMEQVTAGDLRQNIYLDRNDEFGQMAQAFNFMLMSLKERDLLNKGMQHYVSKSIVDKTMKALTAQEKSGEKIFTVNLFVSFFGINEAIGGKAAPEVFQAVRDVTQ
ncbi:MAG TPA: HAMP domain-containing protein, partial [Candidatus Ozemobacteraceae bacterium]|nr:HAMP domain-containing protein [Candidatus Ozemobacteraceae bacterium]